MSIKFELGTKQYRLFRTLPKIMKRRLIYSFSAFVLVSFALLLPSILERHRFYRFDDALWAKSLPKDRYYMACFVVENQMLKGLHKGEVIGMLGRPYEDRGFCITYSLGPERGLISVDGLVLNICFDASGVVIECQIQST